MILRKGVDSPHVANMQRVLDALGFDVVPDGNFGPATDRAVKAYQQANGLVVDGIVGPKTFAKMESQYDEKKGNISSSGNPSAKDLADAETEDSTGGFRKLKGVHPKLQRACLEMIDTAKGEGFKIRVTQGVRTFAEQDALFAKRPRVTRAKGGQSIHNFGMAADWAIWDPKTNKLSWDLKMFDNIGRWADGCSVPLEWGGRWKFRDAPHTQLAGIKSYRPLLEAYNKAGGGEAGIKAAWALVD